MKLIKVLLTLSVLVITIFFGLAFVTHNQTEIAVDLLAFTGPTWPISLWLLLFLAGGVFVGMLVSSMLVFKEKAARRRVEKRLSTTSQLMSG